MPKHEYEIFVRPKADPKGTTGVFVDDFPVLRRLLPQGAIGKGWKAAYHQNLSQGFLTSDRFELCNLFEAVHQEVLRNGKGRIRWATLRCRRPFGQASMQAISDFLVENLEVYLINFHYPSSQKPLNAKGDDWSDNTPTSKENQL